jgi:hypothetical protein
MTLRLTCGSLAFALALTLACGRDVDLGGTADAAPEPDASPELDADVDVGGGLCAPCASAADCRDGRVCGRFAGALVCATPCSTADASACASDQTCAFFEAPGDVHLHACVPSSGACPAADASASRCADYAGPSVYAQCTDCAPSSDDCGLNGCFRTARCNIVSRKCEPPPNGCP